jgi:hypothetical protein
MTYAGHLPTRRFSQEEWLAIPRFDGKEGDMHPDGMSWSLDPAGRAIVVVVPEDWRHAYAVRPIIVVRA